MMTKHAAAIETARHFAALMKTAALAGPIGGKDISARKVEWYLTQTGYWGGPPPTLEEARAAAKRAWGDRIPAEIEEALT